MFVVQTVKDNTMLRDEFVKYLEEGGVNIRDRKFNEAIHKCFHYYYEDIKKLYDYEGAVKIYKLAKRRTGSQTRLKYQENRNIILDGDASDCESNKAFFQMVVAEDMKPYIFKYPQSDDEKLIALIEKDVQFSNYLRGGNNGCFPRGFVEYLPFAVEGVDGLIKEGSICSKYSIVLKSLNPPLPISALLAMGKQILSSLQFAHSLGYCLNDVKPENIFLSNDGYFLLGDYGGFTPIGSDLVEFTPGYLPLDLQNAKTSPFNDYCCLVATVLEMMMMKPSGDFVIEALQVSCKGLDASELKEFLNNLLH